MAELRADPGAGPAPSAGGNPYASAWSVGRKSAARLIAAPAPAAGPYGAGVEIRLDPGASTYWRNPGEAGAPPAFDFKGSDNIRSAAVSWPAPARIDEAGFDAFGYRGDVVFPVEVQLADDSRPAVLALSLDYAVCADICLPVKAMVSLALPARPKRSVAPGAGAADAAPPEEIALEAAQRKTPLRLDAAARDAKFAIARDAGVAKPTWRVRIKAEPDNGAAKAGEADRAGTDIFVEAPEGWWFESKKTDDPNEFLIVEAEAPQPTVAAAATGASPGGAQIPVTVTVAQPRQSYEFTLDLAVVPEPR